jgi:TusA-related sulfurtransferase
MTKEIDVRGLSCPQPIMHLKKAIDAGERYIIILADDAVARDNCMRLAETEGFTVSVEDKGEEFEIKAVKNS